MVWLIELFEAPHAAHSKRAPSRSPPPGVVPATSGQPEGAGTRERGCSDQPLLAVSSESRLTVLRRAARDLLLRRVLVGRRLDHRLDDRLVGLVPVGGELPLAAVPGVDAGPRGAAVVGAAGARSAASRRRSRARRASSGRAPGSRSPSAPARRSSPCPCRSALARACTPSMDSIADIRPRMYSTWPTSSFGPVPWPLACTSFEHVLDDLGVGLGAVLQRQRVVALGAVADVLHVGLGAGPPHAVHLVARVAGGHRLLDRGGVHHAPAPQEHVVGPVLADLQPGGLLLDAGVRHRQQAAARSRSSWLRSCSSAIGSLPYGLSW